MFANRNEAGRLLATRLKGMDLTDPLILGLARGGVVLAAEIAKTLRAPLGVFVVRKVGHPDNPEYGMGAVTESGEVLLDEERLAESGLTRADLEPTIRREREQAARRVALYRRGEPLPDLARRSVVLVDDGIATGGTARAALHDLVGRHPRRLLLAVGVAPPAAIEAFRREGAEVVCLSAPAAFAAVGEFYREFEPVSDREVIELLETARSRELPHTSPLSPIPASRPGAAAPPSRRASRPFPRPAALPQSISIPLPSGASLRADLTVPMSACGLVVFAHGSGSGRTSPRNRQVADRLAGAEIASLLLDLLTETEAEEDELTRCFRFDIPLLTDRLLLALDWCRTQPETGGFPQGIYGASTGGAVALIAAASRPEVVRAVVLRGARSDLAGFAVSRVRAPTLLLVGELDPEILAIGEQSLRELPGPKELKIIPGASHLFEEPGALEQVAEASVRWFLRYLVD